MSLRPRGPGRPKKNIETVQVGLRLRAELWVRVCAAAKADDEYLNAFVENALENALAARKESRHA